MPAICYHRSWSPLVQIMACHLFVTPLPETMLTSCQLGPQELRPLSKYFKQNADIFHQENAFENVVCEMLTISFRPQCIKITATEVLDASV